MVGSRSKLFFEALARPRSDGVVCPAASSMQLGFSSNDLTIINLVQSLLQTLSASIRASRTGAYLPQARLGLGRPLLTKNVDPRPLRCIHGQRELVRRMCVCVCARAASIYALKTRGSHRFCAISTVPSRHSARDAVLRPPFQAQRHTAHTCNISQIARGVVEQKAQYPRSLR